MIAVKVKRLPHARGLSLPARATEDAAGIDLCAALEDPVELPSGARKLIPTGFIWEIPRGYEGQVRPRSGLALKHGLTLLNAPGTIDSDYRGEVCVILCNLGETPFVVERGMRIAQLVVTPVTMCSVAEAGDLTVSQRGDGGFGHTGGMG